MSRRLPFAASVLSLGTVQLGLPYGIANRSGQPSQEEAFRILDRAWAGGITTLDTARAYQEAEARIGQWRGAGTESENRFDIVTKSAAIDRQEGALPPRLQVAESLAASQQALGMQTLPLVLAHRGTDLFDPGVIEAFETARAAGQILAYGASIYSARDGLDLIGRGVAMSAIQLPVNGASMDAATQELLAESQRLGIAIFARSVFLQGALLLPAEALPRHLAVLAPSLAAVDALANHLGQDRSGLLLKAVVGRSGVTSAVIGVELASQLEPHLAAMSGAALPEGVLGEIAAAFSGVPAEALDPSRWPR